MSCLTYGSIDWMIIIITLKQYNLRTYVATLLTLNSAYRRHWIHRKYIIFLIFLIWKFLTRKKSCFMRHMSVVTGQVSPVTCHMSLKPTSQPRILPLLTSPLCTVRCCCLSWPWSINNEWQWPKKKKYLCGDFQLFWAKSHVIWDQCPILTFPLGIFLQSVDWTADLCK